MFYNPEARIICLMAPLFFKSFTFYWWYMYSSIFLHLLKTFLGIFFKSMHNKKRSNTILIVLYATHLAVV